MLQSLATTRSANITASRAVPVAIESDPVTDQGSARLPQPKPAVLQELAKAMEP